MLHVRNQRVLPPPPRTDAADRHPAPADAGPVPRPRDPFFDNAKYLAIVLVAIGHAWTPLRSDSRAADGLYMFVYAFHMPAFILIAGYFSRAFQARPGQLKRLITGIGVPYVVFEIAYVLFKRWADDSPEYPIGLLDPYYVTWFLIALFVWRLTAPLWQVIRWPVPVSLAIASLATVSPGIGDDFNLQRVLQFLPFFVIGMHLRPEHFERLRRPEVRLLAVPVFLGALVTAYWAVPRMSARWFYHTNSAQELGHTWWIGIIMTFALFGCGLLLTAAFLAWVPGRHLWFTALGTATLYGYLLHGFLAKGSRYWGWYDADWVHTPWGQIGVTLIGAVAVTLLCTAPVRRVFRFAVEPSMEWAFRRDSAELGRR
ncbi:acyltransferase family protein [Streptomyces sodiiphilus]|uniref:acyltransferase family protein n=1 Tax=Streptomyces sodiiphilus TaxID=226217 RepID=UPI0031D62EC1